MKGSKLMKVLNFSRVAKKRAGWSRVGAGFLKEEIESVNLLPRNLIEVTLKEGSTITAKSVEFNLRETEELIKFLYKPLAKHELVE